MRSREYTWSKYQTGFLLSSFMVAAAFTPASVGTAETIYQQVLGCPAPSAEALAAVEQLEAKPPIGLLTDLTDSPTEAATESLQDNKPSVSELAADFGLHAYDFQSTVDELRDHLSAYPNAPFSYYKTQVNKKLKLLGLKVIVGAANESDYRLGSHRPALDELRDGSAKGTMISVLATFHGVPKELIDLVGTTQIHLVTDIKEPYVGYATTDEEPTQIFLEVGNGDKPDLTRHEWAHALIKRLCGGVVQMNNDPAFANLNQMPLSKVYNGDVVSMDTPSYDYDYKDQKMSWVAQLKAAPTLAQRHKVMASIWKLGKTIQTVSPYHPNVNEDETDTAKNILNPASYGQLLDPHLPIIRAKFNAPLARLYEQEKEKGPQIVKYLFAIASRPSTYNFAAN